MLIHEMTDKECHAMLAQTHLARLACAHDKQPYVIPIYLFLAGDIFEGYFLYGFATLGAKIEWMRENPLVCVEVDKIISTSEWSTVVVFGEYEELPHLPEHEVSRLIAAKLFKQNPLWPEPAAVSMRGHPPRMPIVFRIRIAWMTGRRARA